MKRLFHPFAAEAASGFPSKNARRRPLLSLSLALFVHLALTLVITTASTPAFAQVNCSGVAAWSPNSVAYSVGNLVTYNGSEYKCLQSHTSQSAWNPQAAASLWQLVGSCGTGGTNPTPTPPPPPPGEGPFGGSAAAIPGTVQAENYDTGGQGVGYSVSSVNGSGNSYRSDGVDLEATSDAGGGSDLGWTSGGQWFRYTVNVASSGTYTVSFRVAAPSAVTDGFHLSNSSGSNLSGNINVPATGGWQTWTTVTANVTLSAGQQVLTLNQDNGGWNINYMSFASAGSPGSAFGGHPAAIPGTVQAENYDTGGQGSGYSVSSVNGSGNSYRSDGVDLETTTDSGGGLDLGWTAGGQWFNYTVSVSSGGTYTVSFRVAAPNAVTDGFHLSNSSGTNLSGNVNVPATGGWQNWTTVTAVVTLSAGQQVLKLNQDNGGWNINYMSFASGVTVTPTPPPPPPPPPGKVFAPYIDISLSTDENPSGIASSAGLHGITLAFLTAGSCASSWGGLGGTLPTDNFPNGDTVTNQVNQLHNQGINVAISYGGASGIDPSAYCGSASQLQGVFQQVINQYHPSRLDFDIEGGSQDNHTWNTLRAQALNGIRSANPGLVISYTLPVLNSGLTTDGMTPINDSKSVGFTPDIVNVMTMDFGSCCDNGGAMDSASEQATSSTHNQIGGTIGITPMIGQNDTGGEIFTLQDATNVVNWANGQGYVGLMAFWSLGRDNGGCAGQTAASATCSGVSQNNWQFSQIFEGF